MNIPIDLAGLVSLFYEASKEWTEPNVVRVDRLRDMEDEPIFHRLKADGHVMKWARETKLRQLKREGWKPVTEHDAIGRPTIFMDRLGELVLMFRASA